MLRSVIELSVDELGWPDNEEEREVSKSVEDDGVVVVSALDDELTRDSVLVELVEGWLLVVDV